MTRAILITDCLQRDFVGSIGRFDPLPSALHIGYDESLRLLGEDPKQGPVARVISWAHQQPDEELRVVHVRDWHDPNDEPDSRYSGAIRVFRRHGGALRTKQVLALGIHPATLYKLRDSGRVIELARGFYRLGQSDECENPDLAVVAARAPDG